MDTQFGNTTTVLPPNVTQVTFPVPNITTLNFTDDFLSNVSKGVVLLSDRLVTTNHTLPWASYVVDGSSDLTLFVLIGAPFLAAWCLGVMFVVARTDADGYVQGKRRVESEFIYRRFLVMMLIYCFEGAQVMATIFTPATAATLAGGSTLRSWADFFLWNGSIEAVFPIVIVIEGALLVVFAFPLLPWFIVKRAKFRQFKRFWTGGVFGAVVSLLQDAFVLYLPLPIMVQLLRPIPCTSYITGEASTALGGTTECWSSSHTNYAIFGGSFFSGAYLLAMYGGSLPGLVHRYGDLAVNGRYMSISYAAKALVAGSYCLVGERHRYYHLSVVFLMQIVLLYISSALRPCLVERLNYHRSAAFAVGFPLTAMACVAAIMNDRLTSFPLVFGIVGCLAVVVVSVYKYYTKPCKKVLPILHYLDGTYEGFVCLGRALPHGEGNYRVSSKREQVRGGGEEEEELDDSGGSTTEEGIVRTVPTAGALTPTTSPLPVALSTTPHIEQFVRDRKLSMSTPTSVSLNQRVSVGSAGDMAAKEGEHRSSAENMPKNESRSGDYETAAVQMELPHENSKREKEEADEEVKEVGGVTKVLIDGKEKELLLEDGDQVERHQKEEERQASTKNATVNYNGNEADAPGKLQEENTGSGMLTETNETHSNQGSALDDVMFTGKFHYGKKCGFGVYARGRYFYKGEFENDKWNGFGATNMVNEAAREIFFEGFFVDNIYNGEGTKKFADGDQYEGTFFDGLEHGEGKWTFDTCAGTKNTGKYSKRGDWERGKFILLEMGDSGRITEANGAYKGERRYGVPHGWGTLVTDEEQKVEGMWRAGLLHGVGKITDLETNRTIYQGTFFEGLFSGEGSYRDELEKYHGEFREGLKHGEGKQKTVEGDVYEGEFVEGTRTGIGECTFADGQYYQGGWLGNVFNGFGYLEAHEYAYQGMWLDGRKDGIRGSIKYRKGVTYVGSWANDLYEGVGKLHLPGLGEFTGQFVEGVRCGEGRFTFLDGSVYQGQWAHDKPNGFGTFRFSTKRSVLVLESMIPNDRRLLLRSRDRHFMDFGGEFTGDFVDGHMHGIGTFVGDDGAKYVGEWRCSVPHGKGKLMFAGGAVYVGEWNNGSREGLGVMHFVDGRVYDGEWIDGRRHGKGKLYKRNGQLDHECEWFGDLPMTHPALSINSLSLMLPPVDIQELLHVLIPNTQSTTEIEESHWRRRVEMDERYERGVIKIFVDMLREWHSIASEHLSFMHEAVMQLLEKEEQESRRVEMKSALGKTLNAWKAQYREIHGVEPKKSAIFDDAGILPLYQMYKSMA